MCNTLIQLLQIAGARTVSGDSHVSLQHPKEGDGSHLFRVTRLCTKDVIHNYILHRLMGRLNSLIIVQQIISTSYDAKVAN